MILNRASLLRSLAALGCIAIGAAAAAENDAPPDDAFLEFLGGFETADGEWVDPRSLAELESSEAQGARQDTEGEWRSGDENDEI